MCLVGDAAPSPRSCQHRLQCHTAHVPAHSHLPHLKPFATQPIVFITAVTFGRKAVLANAGAFETLTSIWKRSPDLDGWFVGDYLLMPDHVHLFARAALDAKPLADWMKTWKSLSSRELKNSRNVPPPLWQRDYFDRFLRTSESYREKWDYVAMNPVRKGWCASPEAWPWKGRLFDLWL
jgi:putative transposase